MLLPVSASQLFFYSSIRPSVCPRVRLGSHLFSFPPTECPQDSHSRLLVTVLGPRTSITRRYYCFTKSIPPPPLPPGPCVHSVPPSLISLTLTRTPPHTLSLHLSLPTPAHPPSLTLAPLPPPCSQFLAHIHASSETCTNFRLRYTRSTSAPISVCEESASKRAKCLSAAESIWSQRG
jgi:hypothetical protein